MASEILRNFSEKPMSAKGRECYLLGFFIICVFYLFTVAINELLCMKNAGAQIAMDFS